MKHISHILLLLAALLVTACTSDDTDFSDIINDVVEPVVVAVDSTALAEQRDVVVTDPTSEAYNDYVENSTFNRTLLIRYAGEQATVSGTVSGVTVSTNGAHVTVTSTVGRLNLRLTGASSNGSLKVYSENKYRLSLEGVTLTNPNGAAINNQCGKTLYVVLADGSSPIVRRTPPRATTSTTASGSPPPWLPRIATCCAPGCKWNGTSPRANSHRG